MASPRGSEIITYTGRCVDVFDPDPASIVIEDIAHALSNLCRFGGHTSRFYSVAEHSANMLKGLAEHGGTAEFSHSMRMTLLLHDASEAYLVDLPRPIKNRMGNYRAVEVRLMDVIAQKFGLRWPFPSLVKLIDDRLLFTEKRDLCPKSDWGWEREPFTFHCRGLSANDAEACFMNEYECLRQEAL